MAIQTLNLATREKQDEILNNFPISGGTDFSSFNGVATNSIRDSSSSWKTVLSVSGEGMLVSLSGGSDRGVARIRVSIDGEEVIPEFNSSELTILPFFEFNTSCVIEGRSTGEYLAINAGSVLLK